MPCSIAGHDRASKRKKDSLSTPLQLERCQTKLSAHTAMRFAKKNAHTKNRTPRNVCFQAQLKPLSKVTGPTLRRKFAKRRVMFTTRGTDRVVFVWPKMLYALLRRVSVSVRQLVGWIVGAARSRTKTH